jgi:signal peptidase I
LSIPEPDPAATHRQADFVLGYSPAPRPRAWGLGLLAVIASLVLPGLGQLLCGRPKRAAGWLLAGVAWNVLGVAILILIVKWRLLWTGVGLVGIIVLLPLLACVDAYRCARGSARPAIRSAWARYALAAILLALMLLAHPMTWTMRVAPWLKEHTVGLFIIGSHSMAPTLRPRDRVLVDRQGRLERWCLVVYTWPTTGSAYIHRLVGLPGETIEIKNGEVYVNGNPVARPAGVNPYVPVRYLGRSDPKLAGGAGAGCAGNPITLGPDEYFVLGDNSANALDSRALETPVDGHPLGAIPATALKGRVTHVYWPPDRWRVFD